MKKTKKKKMKKTSDRYWRVTEFLYILAMLVPITCFLLIILFAEPEFVNGFLFPGLVGTIIIGIGLEVLVYLIMRKRSGAIIVFLLLLTGGVLFFVSVFALYSPKLNRFFDEQMVNYYFITWSFLAMMLILYSFFRMSFASVLQKSGNSKTFLKKHMKGMENYWWYRELHKVIGLRWIYPANIMHTSILLCTLLVHLLFGWWQYGTILVTALFCGDCITSVVLWLLIGPQKHSSIDGKMILLGVFLSCAMFYVMLSYTIDLWS